MTATNGRPRRRRPPGWLRARAPRLGGLRRGGRVCHPRGAARLGGSHRRARSSLPSPRIPASGDDPIGAVATNLGGPGASGTSSSAAGVFSGAVGERFDTLSWDPRGVGESALGCDGEEVDEFARLDSDPDDAAEQAALDAGAQAIAGVRGDPRRAAALRRHGVRGPATWRPSGSPTAGSSLRRVQLWHRHRARVPGAVRRQHADGARRCRRPRARPVRPARRPGRRLRPGDRGGVASCPAGQESMPEGRRVEEAYEAGSPRRSRPTRSRPAATSSGRRTSTRPPSSRPTTRASGRCCSPATTPPCLVTARRCSSWPTSTGGSGAYDLYQGRGSCLDSETRGAASGGRSPPRDGDDLPRFGAAVANEMLPCAFLAGPGGPSPDRWWPRGRGRCWWSGRPARRHPDRPGRAGRRHPRRGHPVVREGVGHPTTAAIGASPRSSTPSCSAERSPTKAPLLIRPRGSVYSSP